MLKTHRHWIIGFFLVTLENLALRNPESEAVKKEMCLSLKPDKVLNEFISFERKEQDFS